MKRFRDPDELSLHPLAHLIPEMTDEEWQNFKEDVNENGIKVPIDISNDDVVLDGKHRWRLAKEMGCQVPVRVFDIPGNCDDALWHMWRTAVVRRHLSAGQIAAIAVDMNNKRKVSGGKAMTGQELADKMSVSRRHIVRASNVDNRAPELIEMVRSGDLQLAEADLLAKQEPEIREKALKKMSQDKKMRADVAIKKVKQDINRQDIKVVPASVKVEGVYKTLVADCPWDYSDIGYESQGSNYRGEPGYGVMSLEQISTLRIDGKHVSELAEDNAHLYLWVVNPMLEQGFDIMRAWGFEYRAIITWAKPQLGLGRYFRHNTEHILFGVRGSMAPLQNDVGTWFKADRTTHSAKPGYFYDIVERVSPGPYLEMFARKKRQGWTTWGVVE